MSVNTSSIEKELLFWPSVSTEFGMVGLICIHVLTMCISIPGNILVILIITNNRTLQEEAAYLLICSVSCADLLVAMVAQPLNITVLVMGIAIKPHLELFFYFSIWGFCGASAFGVVAITIDRCLYILYPMHYIVLLNRRRTIILIMIQWTCGIAYGVLPIIDIQRSLLPTAVSSVVTLVVMTACMSIIYNKIYNTIRRLKQQQQDKEKKRPIKRKQINATGTIALIVLAFFICWFPYITTNFINAAMRFNSKSPIRGMYYWFLGLGCWNSALNVVIYGFKNNTLKKEAKKWLPFNKIDSFTSDHTPTDKKSKENGRSTTRKKMSEPVLSDIRKGHTVYISSHNSEEINTAPHPNKDLLVRNTGIGEINDVTLYQANQKMTNVWNVHL